MYHDTYRSYWLVGYRYLRLDDRLGITERLTSTNPDTDEGQPGLSAFLINDSFNTRNQFNGGEIGMAFELRRNQWSLDFTPKIALGTNRETVSISGSTRTTDPTGARSTAEGGLLALPTNIGTYSKNQFVAVPQFDATIGYQLTRRTRVTLGYSFLYVSQVARAGDQIDREVNSTLLPNSPVPPTGDLTRPRFVLQETGFWAQGVNLGVDFRW
jgi:hypothetical protein